MSAANPPRLERTHSAAVEADLAQRWTENRRRGRAEPEGSDSGLHDHGTETLREALVRRWPILALDCLNAPKSRVVQHNF
jgi:hypothetical protein